MQPFRCLRWALSVPSEYERSKPIVEQKQRTAAAATACAKASRQPAEGPILSTWRHTKFLDRSRLVHMAVSHRPALSSGEANGWFLAKDLCGKK
jgi:hypothetical protein